MTGSSRTKRGGSQAAELIQEDVDVVPEGAERARPASRTTLYEIRSKVDYTQFFPHVDREEPDVVLLALATAPLPEEMLHEASIRVAISEGTITEPYVVDEYTLPPKKIEVPEHLQLVRPADREAAKNILAGNEWGRTLVSMPARRERRTGRPDTVFLRDRLLPVLRYVRYMDQQTKAMDDDMREQVNERIREIEAL